MKTVITGATGAIGVALIKKLLEEKHEILVIARKDSDRNKNIPTSSLVKIIYASLNELKEIKTEEQDKYDTFYHLAWDGTVGADRNNLKKQCDNVKYAIDAVDLAAKLGCKTFIGIGSQAEYGRVNDSLDSETVTNPENGYGVAKLFAGKMTALQAERLEIRHVWVRVLSVYGPCDGKHSLVMSTIEKAKRGETILCTKGEQIWDYLYSSDAAEALYRLGLSSNAKGVYVLGSGKRRLLADYIKDIRDAINPSVKIDFGAVPYQKNQVMFLHANIKKLIEEINWTPKIGFMKGIQELLEDDE